MPLYKVFSIIIFFQFLYGLLHYCFLLHGVYFVRVAFLLKTLQQHFLLEAQSSLRRNILIWNNCIMNIFCFFKPTVLSLIFVHSLLPPLILKKKMGVLFVASNSSGPIIALNRTLQEKFNFHLTQSNLK